MHAIGVIGLGLLGSALAERFLRGGLRVVGFDLRPECVTALAAAGGERATSPANVATNVDVIILSLPDDHAVDAAVRELGPAANGKIIIDTTTGEPERTAERGRQLAAARIAYLDATIAGSSQQARAGEVVVMAGGDVETFRRCETLFSHFARLWFHLGPWGSGSRMKLVVNLVLGLNRAVLAEGLAFARRCGVDPALALDVLRLGPAYAHVMDSKGPKMIAGDFTPEARLSQHLKDVRLILEAGRQAGARLPLTHAHEELLAGLERLGLGGEDNSVVIRAFD